MDSKFVIQMNGKDFILHAGLLNEFHANGGKEIITEMLPSLITGKGTTFLFKATVKGEKGTFIGHGDANSTNVNSLISRHMIRMAETRAVNRALRFYTNVGLCSVDELGGDDMPDPFPKRPPGGYPKYVKKGTPTPPLPEPPF